MCTDCLPGRFPGPEWGLPAHNPRGRGRLPGVSALATARLRQHHLGPILQLLWRPACISSGEAVTVTPLPTSRPPPPTAAWTPL